MLALAIALIILFAIVFLVGVGLFINVYLYKNHALKAVDAHYSLDNQLFVYHGDVDAKDIW